VGAGEGARDEQRAGPRGGWNFGEGWQASLCREARGGELVNWRVGELVNW